MEEWACTDGASASVAEAVVTKKNLDKCNVIISASGSVRKTGLRI